jgi:hypothetical protein
MIDLKRQYESAKHKAVNFMKMGNLSAYFEALTEMNHYKKMMQLVTCN